MKPQVYILDTDVDKCAQAHSDHHLIQQPKIMVEILRAAVSEKHPLKGHVLAKWASGAANYNWLFALTNSMLQEQNYRFKFVDEKALEALHCLPAPITSPIVAPRFVQVLPKAIAGQPVEAYRQFYKETYQGDSWTTRGKPGWFTDAEQLAFNL